MNDVWDHSPGGKLSHHLRFDNLEITSQSITKNARKKKKQSVRKNSSIVKEIQKIDMHLLKAQSLRVSR